MRQLVLPIACAIALSACGPYDLRWQVARADRVALQAVRDDAGTASAKGVGRLEDVLPEGDSPTNAMAPYRAGHVMARRNADGGIDLVTTTAVWHLVGADGRVTPLFAETSELPATGTARAALGRRPDGWPSRSPWQLRLVTPRDNVLDARILVRRNPVLGGMLLLMAGAAGAMGSFALYRGAVKDAANRPFALAIGGADVGVAGLAAGFGLYQLFLPEHDVVLTSAATGGR